MALVYTPRDVPVVQTCVALNCQECNGTNTNSASNTDSSRSSSASSTDSSTSDRISPTAITSQIPITVSTYCHTPSVSGHAFQPVIGNVPVNYVPLCVTSTSSLSNSLPMQVAATVSTSNRTRKKSPKPTPKECKDDAYYERRKRNNESAKRSRELRRMKEHHTSMRVVQLEHENLQLRAEISVMKSELEKLRNILFKSSDACRS